MRGSVELLALHRLSFCKLFIEIHEIRLFHAIIKLFPDLFFGGVHASECGSTQEQTYNNTS
jgi:hypothetical protein